MKRFLLALTVAPVFYALILWAATEYATLLGHEISNTRSEVISESLGE